MQFNFENHIAEIPTSSLCEREECMSLLDQITDVVAPELDLVFSGAEQRIILEENERYELVLCTWYPDSDREWHTHPQTKCYFKCIRGCLHERRETKENLIRCGEHSYIDDSRGGHKVTWRGESTQTPAASVHLYIKEI